MIFLQEETAYICFTHEITSGYIFNPSAREEEILEREYYLYNCQASH
jgi:hypothetical protein